MTPISPSTGSEDMVERVARAIRRSYLLTTGFVDSTTYGIADEVENSWEMWQPEATAALAAMYDLFPADVQNTIDALANPPLPTSSLGDDDGT